MDTAIKPKVSVVMPVYNGGPYLRQAIESVLAQTFKDFEFVIIDDGSTDNSAEIIRSFNDTRIIFLEHADNKGLINTLREGLERAQGEYIARMDGDDIWTNPEKLEKQLEYFDHSEDTVLVGTWATLIDKEGRTRGSLRYPYEDAAIRKSILIKNCFIHPSVMFKKAAAIQAGGFLADEKHVEDYGLWLRLGEHGTLANVPEYLMAYRMHDMNVTRQNNLEQIENSFKLVKKHAKSYPNFALALWKWRIRLFLKRGFRQ